MSGTVPGGDVRGFYAALGIELPGWAQPEASVACFANADAHAHGDRDPSCSVNVENGLWHCWGCQAAGGSYDAALARGRSPRDAIDLMIAYGLTTRRTGLGAGCPSSAPACRPAAPADRDTLLELGCGWERGRVIVPIRSGRGGLRGVLRYAPSHDRAPKMLAARGTRLGLIPHPAANHRRGSCSSRGRRT